MDRTYAETTGHAPFDWNKWLDAAIEQHPGQDDYGRKVDMSADWCLCACGNACAIIPRAVKSGYDDRGVHIPQGAPLDDQLRAHGMEFYCLVEEGRFQEAKNTLQLIEARSAILIQEELAKLNQK